MDCQLAAMSGQRLASFGCGDEESGKLQEQFQSWAQDILEAQTQQADVAAAVDTLEPVIEQVNLQLIQCSMLLSLFRGAVSIGLSTCTSLRVGLYSGRRIQDTQNKKK